MWTRTSTIAGEWCKVDGIPDDDLQHEAWLKDLEIYLVGRKGIRKDVAPTLLQERRAQLKSAFENSSTVEAVAAGLIAELESPQR